MIASSHTLRLVICGLCIALLGFTVPADAFPDQVQPVPAPTQYSFEPVPAKGVFAYGEIVPVEVVVRNAGEAELNLSGIPPEVTVNLRKSGWNRGTVRTIPAGVDSLILTPGSARTLTIPWDQKDDAGHQVDPGVYYLTIRASGLTADGEVVILPPEGVLVGSVSPRDTVTSTGITARIESIILRDNEGLITIGISPSESSSSRLPAPDLSQVTAEYRIDDRPAMNFRDISEHDPGTGGYEITWKTAPVSCAAHELNVRITSIDPYEGLWNYSIDLDPVSRCVGANGTTWQIPGRVEQSATGSGHEPARSTTTAGLSGVLCVAALAGAGVLVTWVKTRGKP